MSQPANPDARTPLWLRGAVSSDVPALVDLVNAAFEHERWLIPGPRLPSADGARELLGAGLVTLVATLADELVGTVRVRFEDEHGADLVTPELGYLAVHPAAQGRGIGSRLVRAAEEVARCAGCDAIELRCGRELGLEPYYAALGFERVAEELASRYGSYRPFTLVTLERRWATCQTRASGA